MPVITIKTDITPPEKKKELVQKLTHTAVEVTGFPANAFTIFIEEYDGNSVGVGGQTLVELMSNN